MRICLIQEKHGVIAGIVADVVSIEFIEHVDDLGLGCFVFVVVVCVFVVLCNEWSVYVILGFGQVVLAVELGLLQILTYIDIGQIVTLLLILMFFGSQNGAS